MRLIDEVIVVLFARLLSSSNLPDIQLRSEATLELQSRAVSSVGVMYCSSSPNTGSNSGGGQILKKNSDIGKYWIYMPRSSTCASPWARVTQVRTINLAWRTRLVRRIQVCSTASSPPAPLKIFLQTFSFSFYLFLSCLVCRASSAARNITKHGGGVIKAMGYPKLFNMCCIKALFILLNAADLKNDHIYHVWFEW